MSDTTDVITKNTMTIKIIAPVFTKEGSYRVGQIVGGFDKIEAERLIALKCAERVNASTTPPATPPNTQEKPEKTSVTDEEMARFADWSMDDLRQKLVNLGVPYKANASRKMLVQLVIENATDDDDPDGDE